MWLTEESNKEEVCKVLKALDVDPSTFKYIKFFDSGAGWMHKFEGHLGGRDGWSGLHICKGPDFDDEEEWKYMDEEERKESSITIDGIEYHFYEGD